LIKNKHYPRAVIGVLFSLVLVWLIVFDFSYERLTNSIGYAFCHQNPARSPFIGAFQFSLCFRCVGLFSGLLFGIIWQLPTRFSSKVFSKKRLCFIAICLLFYIGDSLNASFIPGLLGLSPLYPDHEMIRFSSGYLMGMSVSMLILPLFNHLFYIEVVDKSSSMRIIIRIAGILFTGILIVITLISGNEILNHALNLLTVLSAGMFPTLLYTILILAIGNHANQFETLVQGKNIWLTGLTLSFIQIGLIISLRFAVTKSWGWPF